MDDKKKQYKQCSDTLLETLSQNMVRLRAGCGLSQEALAERAGMHRTFISLVERKKRNVTLAAVEAIAVALGVDAPTLLTPAGGD